MKRIFIFGKQFWAVVLTCLLLAGHNLLPVGAGQNGVEEKQIKNRQEKVEGEDEKEKAIIKDITLVDPNENEIKARESIEWQEIEPERKKHVLEVSNLSKFINEVGKASAGEDLSADYIFTNNQTKAEVAGEMVEMKIPCTKENAEYVVPSAIFQGDEAVNVEGAINGNETVSLCTLAEETDYDVSKQENTASLTNPFKTKRLIVQSKEGFDTQNAVCVIQGYGDIYVLTYKSEEDTKAAFLYLKEIPGLVVETDSMLDVSGIIEAEVEAEEDSLAVSFENSRRYADMPMEGDVTIAVIDSGYDIQGRGSDRITGGVDVTGSGGIQDENGHGTAMADIILANSSPNVKVMPIKVTDRAGRTSILKLYLGVLYAMENGADIINISMNAFRPSDVKMLNEAVAAAKERGIYVVVSAGNAGDDVIYYSPADSEEAIVVSAINADNTAMEYSNKGSTVDFAAYGRIKTTGLSGKTVEASGTSVSAALMSMQIAQFLLLEKEMSYEVMLKRLKEIARDLGETGRDDVFGYGAITPDMVSAVYEENVCQSAQIFNCNWKEMSDEEFNGFIDSTTKINLNRFLKELSEEDKGILLARKTIFSQKYQIVENITTNEETFRLKSYDRYYDYLMEQEYATSWHVSGGTSQTGYFYMSQNGNKDKVILYYTGFSNSEADPNKQAHVTAEWGWDSSPNELYFWDGTNKNNKAFTLGTGNNDSNYIYLNMNFSADVKKHSYVKDGGATGIVHVGGGAEGGGGITDINGKGKFIACTENSKTVQNIGVQVGIGATGIATVGTAGFVGHATITLLHEENERDEVARKDPTCTKKGNVEYDCRRCSKEWVKELDSLGGHDFPGKWKKKDSNGVKDGCMFEQCLRNCGEEGWQRDFKYKQKISYRYMDTDGYYPDYTVHVDDYYKKGSFIPACQHIDDGTTEFSTAGKPGYYVVDAEEEVKINIPRKLYNVLYMGNGATGGFTYPHMNVCCGKKFLLRKNEYVNRGYKFKGWSRTPNGAVELEDGAEVLNLSYTNRESINLYAVWEPVIYTIRLDSQGADSGKEGTPVAYQWYSKGYYTDSGATAGFPYNRIVTPEKTIADASLLGGVRQMQFYGYYTGGNGSGDIMVQKDGSLIANMAGAGDYRYFASDAFVYAWWMKKYAVQFSDNLTDADRAIVGNEKNHVPEVKWKNTGESITVGFEPASIRNPDFTQIYRLKGWSRTPIIYNDSEIILCEDRPSVTFTTDEDVTLYAQWDTSFRIAYVGNVQSEGMDYQDTVLSVRDNYLFCPSDKASVETLAKPGIDYFLKYIKKPTIDKETGEPADKNGNASMETVLYSFQGWSMVSEKEEQNKREVYSHNKGLQRSDKIVRDAISISKQVGGRGLTFGAPVAEYQSHNAPHVSSQKQLSEALENNKVDEITFRSYTPNLTKVPYVNMYAIWDQYPQIEAANLYFTLTDAKSGKLTEERLLSEAKATDEEQKNPHNSNGQLQQGKDLSANTSFTIEDYQETELTGAEEDVRMTITYRAEDSVGNVTKKTVDLHLVDTSAQEYDPGEVRFISGKYSNTLSKHSIWKKGDYAATLSQALDNRKSGEEYTKVSALERVFGAKPVLRPGSGNWNRVKQIWEFSNAQIKEVQAYVDAHGMIESQKGFLTKFGSCRKK